MTYLRDRTEREGLSNVVSIQAAVDSPNLSEPVDLVLIVDAYHHIGSREIYFRRLRRSLRPRAGWRSSISSPTPRRALPTSFVSLRSDSIGSVARKIQAGSTTRFSFAPELPDIRSGCQRIAIK